MRAARPRLPRRRATCSFTSNSSADSSKTRCTVDHSRRAKEGHVAVTIEIKAPTFPESITDGTVAAWHKQPGEVVRRDDVLVEIETDKVVLEVVAPADGTLKEVLKGEG